MLSLAIVVMFSFSERSFFSFPPTGFSLKWYVAAWESGLFLGPALRSLALAALATALATALAAAFALPAALGVRRLPAGRLRGAVEFVFLSPLIVPALIIGIALLYAYNCVRLLDTFAGLLASHVLIVFPFMFRALLTSALALRPSLLEASEVLGVSLDRFTVSLFVTQSEQLVLPVAL